MEQSNHGTDESKAPFNMALDTLRSIRTLIDGISEINSDPTLSPAQKQCINVQKVRSLFTTSSSLLPLEAIEKYKEIVGKLKNLQKEVPITKYGKLQKRETRLMYDENLDIVLYNLVLDIQAELKKEKYFMPPRKDLSRAVTEM